MVSKKVPVPPLCALTPAPPPPLPALRPPDNISPSAIARRENLNTHVTPDDCRRRLLRPGAFTKPAARTTCPSCVDVFM
eukprot:scaffold29928_cov129-Isochrysis_galbana.AAC.1